MFELPAPTTHIELDVSLSGAPISGTLLIGGVERRFVGWLELINAIEDTRSGEALQTPVAGES